MKNTRYFFLFLTYFFSCQLLYSTDLLISQPGKYKLGDSIISSPVNAGDTIITISSSNVLFGLGGYTLSQGNNVADCAAIVINQNLNDIIVQNGYIQNVTGTGVFINQGCSKIKIDSVVCNTIGFEGLALSGIGTNQITDVEVSNCRFLRCANGLNGVNGLLINQASRINVLNSYVTNINKPGATINAFNMNNCSQCSLSGIGVNGNTAGTLTLFSDNIGLKNIIQNTLVSTNTGTTIICYSITGCNAESFINCTASSNQASGSLTGFLFASTSTANYLERCLISTNTGGAITGYSFSGSSSQNILVECSALSNFANVANLFGIVVNNANFGILLRSNASYNFNTTANATVGINFQNPTIGVSWSVIDAITERNIAAGSAANSFGILVGASGNNLFQEILHFQILQQLPIKLTEEQ